MAACQTNANMKTAAHPPEASITELIARHKPGFSLERDFYVDEAIYRADLDRIWRQGWLFMIGIPISRMSY